MTDFLVSPILERKDITSVVKLQNIIFPNLDICTVEELFLRLNPKVFLNYEQDRAELKKGGVVSCDTYFNSFSVQKWKDYTNVKTINISLNLKGAFKVKLLNVDYFTEAAKLVDQKLITTNAIEEVIAFENIEIYPYTGLLYVEIEALAGNSLFTGGHFYTNLDKSQLSNEKVAVVICTYKRELYVRKNIQLLEDNLLNKIDLGDKFEVFIIDNGRNLEGFENPKIHLVHNKNAGGTGGFTRGIIEAFKRKNEFSHIIFMDDDVIIAPEIFERIYHFKRVSNDRSLCIGGSMLKLDSQYMQHENGAIWDREIIRVKPELDLRLVKNVLFNEIEEYINYSGWWLFCYPTKVIDDFSLPYPFFIRMDDIELPIRLKRKVKDLKIVHLNGVSVWHEPFENKYSPTLTSYYLTRNELILSSLWCDNFSRIDAMKYILKASLREAFCYRYKSAELALKAASDFLQGPNYLKTTNPEEKNREVLRLGEKVVKKPELPFVYEKHIESIHEIESRVHRFIRLITLNGHLLPSFLFRDDKRLTDKGYRIAPTFGYRPINVFRAKKALYYNLVKQEGFVVRLSRGDFLKVFIESVRLSLKMLFQFPKLRKLYRETLPELTNRTFWENYLEINKDRN